VNASEDLIQMKELITQAQSGDGNSQDKQDTIDLYQEATVLTMATKLVDNGMGEEQANELASMAVARVSNANGYGLKEDIKESAEAGWATENTVTPKPDNVDTPSKSSGTLESNQGGTPTTEKLDNVEAPSKK